jgi:hypothetical protein
LEEPQGRVLCRIFGSQLWPSRSPGSDVSTLYLAKEQSAHPFLLSDVVGMALSLADKLPSASPARRPYEWPSTEGHHINV